MPYTDSDPPPPNIQRSLTSLAKPILNLAFGVEDRGKEMGMGWGKEEGEGMRDFLRACSVSFFLLLFWFFSGEVFFSFYSLSFRWNGEELMNVNLKFPFAPPPPNTDRNARITFSFFHPIIPLFSTISSNPPPKYRSHRSRYSIIIIR